ncbi:MAG: FAD-binding protein [Coriobacteriia bacterium]|nr:FAD-binding protein [Coriobacteriia bacterium]
MSVMNEASVSRRNLVKGAALGAAALGAATLASGPGAAHAAEGEYKDASTWVKSSQNVTWDEEHDIVIVGYGMAGTTAYVEAVEIDPNVDVVIYDKSDEQNAGGQAVASGQCVIFPQPEDIETFRTYMRAMNKPNDVPEEDFMWLTNEFSTDIEWIQAALEPAGYEVGYSGGGALRYGTLLVEFPDLEGADFVGATGHFRAKDGGVPFENGGCWNGMSKAAEVRGAKPNYEHTVTCLVQDSITKRVDGVGVQKPDGSTIYVKANKGVLLATGGYEGDPQMYRDFNGGDMIYNAGSPYVTGDGVKMQMAIGAKMWHMDNHTMSCGMFHGIKVPDFDTCFIRQFYMAQGSWMETAADGTRYYDETRSYQRQHMKFYEHGQYVDVPIGRSQPVHIIFDDACCKAQPMVNDWIGWPVSCRNPYEWSADNSVEIEKGWITKADTIEELAEKIGKDPAALKASVDRFNEMVDGGEDLDFGRDITTMAKIETPPFYAIEEFPAMPACSGGARRNIKGQVLNWDEQPIENLYSAGEIGSLVSNLYQNGTYLHEAICSARAAIDTMLGGRADIKPTEGAGVSEPWAEAEDGEYRVEAKGLEDPYELVLTIKDGQLASIELGEGADNMFMSPEQFEELTGNIVDNQTISVDTIAGATIDSQAIVGALMTAFGKKTS